MINEVLTLGAPDWLDDERESDEISEHDTKNVHVVDSVQVVIVGEMTEAEQTTKPPLKSLIELWTKYRRNLSKGAVNTIFVHDYCFVDGYGVSFIYGPNTNHQKHLETNQM